MIFTFLFANMIKKYFEEGREANCFGKRLMKKPPIAYWGGICNIFKSWLSVDFPS